MKNTTPYGLISQGQQPTKKMKPVPKKSERKTKKRKANTNAIHQQRLIDSFFEKSQCATTDPLLKQEGKQQCEKKQKSQSTTTDPPLKQEGKPQCEKELCCIEREEVISFWQTVCSAIDLPEIMNSSWFSQEKILFIIGIDHPHFFLVVKILIFTAIVTILIHTASIFVLTCFPIDLDYKQIILQANIISYLISNKSILFTKAQLRFFVPISNHSASSL